MEIRETFLLHFPPLKLAWSVSHGDNNERVPHSLTPACVLAVSVWACGVPDVSVSTQMGGLRAVQPPLRGAESNSEIQT